MAKNDKEFGKWKSTTLVPRKISIKRYEFGIIVKEGDFTDRTRMPKGTSYHDVSSILNDYYANTKNVIE